MTLLGVLPGAWTMDRLALKRKTHEHSNFDSEGDQLRESGGRQPAVPHYRGEP